MSNLKEKAKEVHAAGVEARGDFTPEGAPKNMYRYWMRHSNSKRARQVRDGAVRENFCHFWRVVAIWGPLMFARKSTGNFFDKHGAYILMTLSLLSVIALVVAAASVEAVAAFFGMVFMFLAVAGIGGVGLCAGFFLTLAPMEKYEVNYRETWRPVEREWNMPLSKTWAKVVAVVTAPFSLPGAAVAGLTNIYRKNPEKFVDNSFNVLIVLVVPWIAGLAIFSFVAGIMEVGFAMTMLYIVMGLAGAAALAGIFIGGGMAMTALGDFIKGRRRLAEKRREEARLAFFDEHGYWPEVKSNNSVPGEPGAIAKFFTTIGDFVVLYAQVARVNKWKICPLVDIEDEKQAA